jgi:ribosomal protein S13
MARIAGVDLPLNKRVQVGLTYIYGIGRTRATRILDEAAVNKDVRVKDLTEDDVRKIRLRYYATLVPVTCDTGQCAVVDATRTSPAYSQRKGWSSLRKISVSLEIEMSLLD